MSIKKNCWEIMNCGRQPGGDRVDECGVCPAAVDVTCDGVNGGKNGGRFCWAVAGTRCGGKLQGMFALKIEKCVKCEVFQRVAGEEAEDFILHIEEKRYDKRPENSSASSPKKIKES